MTSGQMQPGRMAVSSSLLVVGMLAVADLLEVGMMVEGSSLLVVGIAADSLVAGRIAGSPLWTVGIAAAGPLGLEVRIVVAGPSAVVLVGVAVDLLTTGMVVVTLAVARDLSNLSSFNILFLTYTSNIEYLADLIIEIWLTTPQICK